MDVPTHRIVNGEIVPLTDDEIAAMTADWIAEQAKLVAESTFASRVNEGFDTGYGWRLPIDDESRVVLGELRTQLNEGISLGAWTNSTPCPVQLRAMDGSLHSGTIGEVRALIFEAGNYYAQLVTARRAAQNGQVPS